MMCFGRGLVPTTVIGLFALAALCTGATAAATLIFPLEAWAAVESNSGAPSTDAALEGSVTVVPDQAFNGDEITVTLQGFRSSTWLPAGSVSLGGVWIPIPGLFDYPGQQPFSDPDGRVTFKSQVPKNVPIGPQTLTVQWGADQERTAPFTVLSPSLTVTPKTTVANQPVIIRGSGFTPSSVPGGEGPMGVHQISGNGKSFASVDGFRLGSTYLPYPIDLDSDGTLYATMVLPVLPATTTTGGFEVTVTDTNDRTGKAQIQTQSRALTIVPLVSPPNSTVTLTGRGFIASNDAPTGSFSVDITYDGDFKYSVVPDSSGVFVTQMRLPFKISGGFPKIITATDSGNLGSATTFHDVPARQLHLDPNGGPPGSVITITGMGFTPFGRVSNLTMDRRPMLPVPAPSINERGEFTASIVAPNLGVGFYIVAVVVDGLQYFGRFQLTTEGVTANPLPKPQGAPVSLAASAESQVGTPADRGLALLGANLVGVWNREPATGRWKNYDPVATYGEEFTLRELIPDKLYLIRVLKEQSVTLNQRERHLYPGWNRVHW